MSLKSRKSRIGRPCIGDKPMTATERKRRSRAIQKKVANLQTLTQAVKITDNNIIAEVEIKPGELQDTTKMGWYEWSKEYLQAELLPHQIENLQLLESNKRCMINDPRQHGKTNYVVKIFCVRRLCETVFTGPRPILYISHSLPGVILMTMKIKEELIGNERILRNYGELVNFETFKQSRVKKQTQNIINLVGPAIDSHHFQGVSTASKVRGTSAIHFTIIDDPIDVEKEEETEAATKKFLMWLKYKIMPFTRGKFIFIIGTRYGTQDLYSTLLEEKIYSYVCRSAVKKILPYTVNYPDEGALRANHIIPEDESEWELLAPSLWAGAYNGSTIQNIIYEMVGMGHRATQQELMNNPIPLNPLIIWEWFNDYDYLPISAKKMEWSIGVDVAAGESKDADYTAMVLIGKHNNDFYIDDFIFGKWTGKVKQARLESLVSESSERLDVDHRFIKILIETVMAQRDFYQRIRDESFIIPKAISPSARGRKKSKGDVYARINSGLAQEMENGKVYLRSSIRNKRQLKIEVDGFPNIKDDHAIDISDQIIYYLKKQSYDLPLSGKTTSSFDRRTY